MINTNAADSKAAGARNEKLVIELLRTQGALSQSMICSKTGLNSSTISYIVRRLREKELILEKPGKSNKRGAKPVLIDINPAGQFIVGAEINPSSLLIGLFDFNNNLKDKIRIPLDTKSPDGIIDLLEVNIKGLQSKNAVIEDKLVGIGITISGSISSDGIVQLSSSLGWKNVPLKGKLVRKFNCSVDIYTTKVRLLAEISIQPPLASNNIVYLNVGNGVGATASIDGRLVHGSTNRCGELGHVVIDPEGPLCGCGLRGCLEAHISGPSIADKIRADLAGEINSVLVEMLNEQDAPEDVASKLKAAIEMEDQYAIEVQNYIAEKLSRAAAIAINLYDPDTIILAGYINAINIEYFIGQIKRCFITDVYDSTSRNINIISARVGTEALIRGVAAAVRQKIFKLE